MTELVTKDEAHEQIRLDSDADDAWLDTWIPIVSSMVLLWLKDAWRAYVPMLDEAGKVVVDENGIPVPVVVEGEPVVQPVVKGAVLLELASQHRFRDGDGAAEMPSDAGHGYVLSRGATSQLIALRRPTVA